MNRSPIVLLAAIGVFALFGSAIGTYMAAEYAWETAPYVDSHWMPYVRRFWTVMMGTVGAVVGTIVGAATALTVGVLAPEVAESLSN